MRGRIGRLLAEQRLRYLLVGGYNTAFGYGLFALLVVLLGDDLHYIGLLLISHVVSTLNAFLAYRFVVFRVRGSFFRDLFRFWTVYAGAIVVNVLTLPLVIRLLGFGVLPAQAVVVAVTTVATYTAHRYFSFRRPGPPGVSEPGGLDDLSRR